MKKIIQTLTLALALCLFTGYVVYSQLTRTNTNTNSFAPSSKWQQVIGEKQVHAAQPAPASNGASATFTNPPGAIRFASSNGNVVAYSNVQRLPSSGAFFPGSKSAVAFVPADGAALISNAFGTSQASNTNAGKTNQVRP